jgi:TrmH family RNA methyltransferase
MDVVFVEPQDAGNIGFVARAMANFGLKKLVLVKPCAITPMARARAVRAWPIVQQARVAKTFDAAIKPYDVVIGTTAKPSRSTTRSAVSPRELRRALSRGRHCLVLGREDSGLTNAELRKCDVVVTIPTDSRYRSMNVSHAASIVFYELYGAEPGRESNARDRKLLVRFFAKLARNPALHRRNPENAVKMFRNVVSRSFVSATEASGILGVLRVASEALRKTAERFL